MQLHLMEAEEVWVSTGGGSALNHLLLSLNGITRIWFHVETLVTQ